MDPMMCKYWMSAAFALRHLHLSQDRKRYYRKQTYVSIEGGLYFISQHISVKHVNKGIDENWPPYK